MAPESPKIVKGMIGWFRNRRYGGETHRGDRIIKGGSGIDPSYFRRKWTSSQVPSDISGISPAENEGAAVQMIQEIGNKSPLKEWGTGKISPDMSVMPLTKQEAPGLVGPEVAGKMAEITRGREIYKEGHMNDMHYVVRDDNESSLVRRLHPECSVMIPADYKAAIDEIKTCPLNCPYRTLEFIELDQRTIQSRT